MQEPIEFVSQFILQGNLGFSDSSPSGQLFTTDFPQVYLLPLCCSFDVSIIKLIAAPVGHHIQGGEKPLAIQNDCSNRTLFSLTEDGVWLQGSCC